MARAYTQRLGYVDRDGPFDVILWIVQEPSRIVIRDWVIALSTASQVAYLFVDSPGGTRYFISIQTGTTPAVHHWEGRQAMNVGDQLGISIAGAGRVRSAVTGYDLEA